MTSSKTWLVTGASSILGAAVAETALQAGHKVIATARNCTKAAEDNPRILQLGGSWIELDVASPSTTKIVEDAVNKAGGVIDVVVNNAGYSLLGSIEDMSEDEIEVQFSTIVYGPVRVLKAVLPFMRMSESLARELQPFGIRVLVAEPGSLRTNFWSAYVEPRAGMNKAYVGTPWKMSFELSRRTQGPSQAMLSNVLKEF
ncbi:short-chain dehydrogenase/reductase SDR [Penicillium cinerascens]|uniref:Short-chain dehydrogenase/reductase SDR n=1 Tax=Penicillium cinerascens TaxID=70096 RepID=A0A9W9SZM1_9EURO|nr:short-chain dehydrogenase/reductase SDR [Penicillium cinerascens]KAJ5203927.1 short-chain dehydrogenase/reductase SDR [Penicillium cinerascens]